MGRLLEAWSFVLFVTMLIVIRVHGRTEEMRKKADIYSLHIRSDIRYRFATTTVTSRVANKDSKAREVSFHVTLPKSAFIANFSMEIDGKVYPGNVKEKKKAKQEYDRAVSLGQSAGYVGTKARDSNNFEVSVNVGGLKKVTFTLIYQELLKRRLDSYEHLINIDPGQVVRDMLIQVAINETRKITSLTVPPLRKDFENIIDGIQGVHETATVNRTLPNTAFIEYRPTMKEQRDASENGIRGQFVVKYDVQRDLDAGEVQIADGYFVHYFAPTNLTPVNKNVLFILDVSGSMSGKKIMQTKEAMLKILSDLRSGDNFNLITFSTRVSYWKKERLVPVNMETIAEAKEFVSRMRASGGTNINDAVLQGLQFLKKQDEIGESNLASMLIFLTDGEPTSGETSISKILSNIQKSNKRIYTLYSLGFGHGADFSFLQKLSLQNGGLARKIYEDSDANLQLEGFYKEISTPLLSDIKITYLDDIVENETLTENIFHCFFDGTEIIVAGKLKRDNFTHFRSEVHGKSATGDLLLQMDVELFPPLPELKAKVDQRSDFTKFTERLWAYLTIKELLRKEMESSNETEQESYKQRALHLSLKYSFVSPLTSMVVTKPDQEEGSVRNLEDADSAPHPDLSSISNRKSHQYSPLRVPYQPIFGLGYQGPRGSYSATRHLLPAVHLAMAPGILRRTKISKMVPPALVAATHSISVTTTPLSTTTTPLTGNGNKYIFMKLKSSTSQSQKIPVCIDINPADGALYQFLRDNKTGLTINIGVSTFNDIAYISEIYIAMPKGKDVHLTPGGIHIGNNTVTYQRQTLALGRGWKIMMRNKNQIRLRYGSTHTIRIRRGVIRDPVLGRKSTLSVIFVKGVQSESSGIQGYLWHASANIRKQRTKGLKHSHMIRLSKPHQPDTSCMVESLKQVKDINSRAMVRCFTGSCLTPPSHFYQISDIRSRD